MTPEDARAELLESHGNAFLVAGAAMESRVAVLAPPALLVFTPRGAANLCAWLIMVAGIGRDDLAPIFAAAGVGFPLDRQTP